MGSHLYAKPFLKCFDDEISDFILVTEDWDRQKCCKEKKINKERKVLLILLVLLMLLTRVKVKVIIKEMLN